MLLLTSFLLASLSLGTEATTRQTDCLVSTYGSEYTGNVSRTISGRQCQRWDSQQPHGHPWTQGNYFPDGDMAAVAGNCRNPDAFDGGLWCYTEDPAVRWEPCEEVPQCHDMPECRLTTSGVEYRGSASSSSRGSAGRQCLAWGEEYPELQGSSFCRNPDAKEGGPWCIVGEDGEWDYCDIPYCKPSAPCTTIAIGEDYVGTVAVTENGRFCQRWDVQWPHQHEYTDPAYFPDASLEDAENYCRNPNSEEELPWCFTTNPDIRWEFCKIQQCPNCKVSATGREYAGTLNQTMNGRICQAWDVQAPHAHPFTDPDRFPDVSVGAAGNMCRNPDNRPEGPWCYTTTPGIEWQPCDVPTCKEKSSRTRHPRLARHVLHIGVDGLDPCFVDAPGGAANIQQRLGALGTSTVNGARNVIPAYSGPNWAAHMAAMHVPNTGVTGNGWLPPWRGNNAAITPVTGRDVPFPSVSGHLKAHDDTLRVAAFHGWDWIQHMASYGMPGTLHKEMYCSDKMEGQNYKICDEYLIGNTTAYLRDVTTAADSSYTFIYLSQLDVVGHAFTWCNEQYMDYVNVTDTQVGRLLDVLDEGEGDLWDDMVVILSTDHGGSAFSHGWDDDRDVPIPLYMRGKGVRSGHTFRHTVRNYDIGATAAYVLGLPLNPWWDGKVLWEALEEEEGKGEK